MNQMTKNLIYTLGVIVLLAIPLIASDFLTTMIIRIMYYSLLAIGFAFLAGQLGLISLAIPAFMAVSGYTIGILETRGLLSFPFSVLAAMLMVLVIGAVFGIFVNRSQGIYFLMLTLILGQIVWAIVLQWASFTKGSSGIIGIEKPDIMKWRLGETEVGFYYILLVCFILIVLAVLALTRSSFGLKLKGIRESETRMKMLGYPVARLKWTAFMISAFISGTAGVFFVYYTGVMPPSSINLDSAAMVLIASIFGGVQSIIGAILGMSIIKTFEISLSGLTQRYLIIIGTMFLLVIIYAPKGLMGLIYKNKYMQSLYQHWYRGGKKDE